MAREESLQRTLKVRCKALIGCLHRITGSDHAENPAKIPAPQASVFNAPPSPCVPKEWALPWSNALLRERIEEREREPGCGGGLARRKYHQFFGFALAYSICTDLPDVSPMDPAARYITRNALKDLAHFTFERDPQPMKEQLVEGSRRSNQIAFSVTDFDKRRETTLKTSSCSRSCAQATEKNELLGSLFRPVPT